MFVRGTAGAPQNTFGVVTGSITAVQFPSEPAIVVKFQARLANSNTFYIGNAVNNLTYELDAGEETDWFECENLSLLWHSNGSGTMDYLAWWLQR